MAKLSDAQITRCVFGALEKAAGAALPDDWGSRDEAQRGDAPLEIAKLTPRDKDELIHAIRRELRAFAAYCHIEPIHIDRSATVRDLIAFVRSHHQPIP